MRKELGIHILEDRQAHGDKEQRDSKQGGSDSVEAQIRLTGVWWAGSPAGAAGTRALVKLPSLRRGSQTGTWSAAVGCQDNCRKCRLPGILCEGSPLATWIRRLSAAKQELIAHLR